MDNRGRPSFDVPRYLSALPLFNDVAPAALARLSEGCTLRRLARGEPVFRVGDACNEFHVCVIGQVKLFALSPDGHEKVMILAGDLATEWLEHTRFGTVLREGLLIGGWVAMWRPIEIFLYDWWPIRGEARLYDRLSASTVEVVASRPG